MKTIRIDDGPELVVVTPAVAAWLARPLRELVQSVCRRDGIRVPAEVGAVLTAFDKAARSLVIDVEPRRNNVDQELVRVGTSDDDDETTLPHMSIEAAARSLQCSASYARRLRRDGRLTGVRVDGTWRVFEWSIAEYQTSREDSAR